MNAEFFGGHLRAYLARSRLLIDANAAAGAIGLGDDALLTGSFGGVPMSPRAIKPSSGASAFMVSCIAQ
jgi:hypothetical protein